MAEGSLSNSAIYRARPTLRFNGAENLLAADKLLAMKLTEAEGGLSSLELRLSNWSNNPGGSANFAFTSDPTLQLGAPIEIYSGDELHPCELFRGKISGIEADFPQSGAPELVLLAEDALMAARMARRSRSFDDKAPADVVREIAGDIGLEPVITGLDKPVATWTQRNETDLAFLRRLLQRFDADLQVVGKQLQVSPRGDVRRGELELVFGSQLTSVRAVADLSSQVTAVGARGWNAAAGSGVVADISSGAHLGPGSGKSGADLLRDAFGERREQLGQVSAASDDEVNALAQTAFDARARRFVCVDGVCDGNAKLRVGVNLRLVGLDGRFDNTYYVVRARHVYDLSHGYRTEFRGECAWIAS